MPSTTHESDVDSDATRKERREEAFEQRADDMLDAYYARLPGARMTKAHTEVEAVLASMKPHHRGALALLHSDRVWPAALKKACGEHTSLVVRLFCADNPAVGKTHELEAAAAEKLNAMLTATPRNTRVVDDLDGRAFEHVCRAHRAFLKALKAHRSASR